MMEPEQTRPMLWEVYKRHQSLSPSHQALLANRTVRCHHRPTKHSWLSRTLSRLSPFGSVYALDDSSQSDDSQSQTSVEKLGTKRPAIVVSDGEITQYMAGETARSRVRDLFSITAEEKQSRLHPDMESVTHSIFMCGLSVFIVTSFFGGRAAKETFLMKSKHRTFETKFLYARAYNDALIMGGMKFGLKWCIKVVMFSTLYLVTAQTIATYRNKSSPWEYVAGGVVTGSILRFNLGPKGMFAGGVIGSVLGLIGGGCIYVLMLASNETQEQKHYWRIHEKMQKRREIEHRLGLNRAPQSEESGFTNNSLGTS